MLAEQWKLTPFVPSGRALTAEGTHLQKPVLIIKPQTYMNRSGRALAPLTERTGFDAARDLLVLVDDVALPLGSFRLRARGTPGGHHGLESIEEALGSTEYARLRVGVGPVPEGEDTANFVLSAFEEEELDRLAELLPPLADAVECWLEEGIDEAMNQHNKRGLQSD